MDVSDDLRDLELGMQSLESKRRQHPMKVTQMNPHDAEALSEAIGAARFCASSVRRPDEEQLSPTEAAEAVIEAYRAARKKLFARDENPLARGAAHILLEIDEAGVPRMRAWCRGRRDADYVAMPDDRLFRKALPELLAELREQISQCRPAGESGSDGPEGVGSSSGSSGVKE